MEGVIDRPRRITPSETCIIVQMMLLIVLISRLNNSDHYTLLGNCPSTPPLNQHFALSQK